MKRIFLVILFIAIIFTMPNSVNAEEEQERFVWITSTDQISFYLDTQRIELFQGADKKNKEMILDIWIKKIPTKEYCDTQADWYSQHDDTLLAKEHLQLSYMLNHVQLSTNMKFKDIASYYIRNDGTHKYTRFERNQWEFIIPQTSFEIILLKSFSYIKDNNEKVIIKNSN